MTQLDQKMSFKFSQHLGIAELELKAPAQLHARAWFENIRLQAEHDIAVVMNRVSSSNACSKFTCLDPLKVTSGHSGIGAELLSNACLSPGNVVLWDQV